MGMRIDQPRQQNHAPRIDTLHPSRLEPAPNGNDPPIPHQHVGIAQVTLLRIEADDMSILNQQRARLPKCSLTQREQEGNQNTMQQTRHGSFQAIRLPPILQANTTAPRALPTATPNNN